MSMLSFILYWILGLLRLSWRVVRKDEERLRATIEKGFPIAYWHGELLPLALLHASPHIAPMVSLSRDGAIVSRILQRLGYSVIRGSSSKGGSEALRSAQKSIAQGISPALAVDGPRGPRLGSGLIG